MNSAELERLIRRAGYDIRQDDESRGGVREFYALRNGKRHTRSQPSLLALAEHLGCVERPVEFVDDDEGLETVLAQYAQERNHFVVQRAACRVALFRQQKYVQIVSAAGLKPVMYELRTDGLRRASISNLPPEVVAAFADVPPD